MPEINGADTAWILASTAMVVVMTFGLAIFYGGMVRSKNVLNTMMMVVATVAILTVVWFGWAYSLAFSEDVGGGLVGGFDEVGMKNTMVETYATIPKPLFATFQLTFAIITCALVCGSIVDRAKFSAWCVFIVFWTTVVYAPMAHWIFYFGEGVDDNGDLIDPGWLVDLGTLDFAGGTAVEICSGASGLALALVIGQRKGWKRDPMRPHNLTLVMLGAGLLWFGWFGFNAGSALGANAQAALALTNTMIAGALGIIGWMIVEQFRDKTLTSFGAASGAVAGLVAITPSCGSITPIGAGAVGLIAGIVCSLAIGLKYKAGYDDSLDVVGVHMVGGTVGLLLIGLLASSQATGILTEDPGDGIDGLLYGGGLDQLGKQAVAVGAALTYAFVMTYVIGILIHKTIGFRVSPDEEVGGLDLALHAETAYELGVSGSSTGRMAASPPSGGPGDE
ncbi:ammonium transporter [Sporichthya sp.]|uniref:ammonium transporter n=1 Tax=Sporichthya sp. TaxID=65475 RepID=UPI0018326E4F|nr:ammonium transporter [Sporichthya sp.]MBA3745006.1 ammonium transporter [Sporichthya sp.]